LAFGGSSIRGAILGAFVSSDLGLGSSGLGSSSFGSLFCGSSGLEFRLVFWSSGFGRHSNGECLHEVV